MGDPMGGMGPVMMVVMLIVALIVLGVAVAGGVWLVRTLTERGERPRGEVESDAAWRDLRRRYAAGEIDREEYLQRKIDLEE